ncbi:MAG: N-6 DNA methylase [Ginsengibacter sp.]
MPLFQQSVLKKYIADINVAEVLIAWGEFQAHFFNADIRQNIRNSKEEEYQEGFIRDLFVKILGYTLNPQPGYNFVLEKKTITDATKSDGAIQLNGEVIGVVELKDTGTPDLDKVSTQAFGYKHKHKNCTYIITSNFEKLRFYINDATDFEEFDLFTLNRDRFMLLYLCLHKQNLQADLPLKIKQESLVQEENVTKKLYADYSLFKRSLFQNITAQNPGHDKLLLFKKTQKLLDRFLFILFAEDRLLVPPNSVREILKQWEQLRDMDNYVPLYERFKKYFGYLNVGHTGKHHEIFAYNGGLFLPDEVLDNIIIDDTILFAGTTKLSNYDFNTEVDVNILGHIFEHSLTEIEELQMELEGRAIEKSKTKRKKECVFYTPRYITKYIVENTVGALCTQKKEELQINEETFSPQKRKANRKALLEKIEVYRNWLLHLTICDPACGSGAFLNAALEYLKAEHKTADELIARMLDVPIVFTDLDNSILENNLYGVDINEDAIEIAKLSLWLHTAKKGRKLSNLSDNIKCGNSLIDDPTVAGAKAFNWKEEFKNVFDNGGFDVVIGNPPYALMQPKNTSNNELEFYKKKFDFAEFKIDLFHLFFQLGFAICREQGLLSFIAPSTLLYNFYAEKLRRSISARNAINQIVVATEKVFEDADVHTAIYFFKKTFKASDDNVVKLSINLENIINGKSNYNFIKQKFLSETPGNVWNLLITDSNVNLLNKISKNPKLNSFANINRGLITGDRNKYFSSVRQSEKHVPILTGSDIYKYFSNEPSEFVLFERPKTSGGCWDKEVHLANHKICVRQIGFYPTATFIHQRYAVTGNIFTVITKDSQFEKFLLAVLNSKVIKYYWQIMFNDFKTSFPQVSIFSLSNVPIPKILKEDQQHLIALTDIMLEKNKDLNVVSEQFTKLLLAKFSSININNKLQAWHSLSANEFLKELSKQKIKLSLAEQQEWLQYFEEQKARANNIQQLIKETDKQIDAMVYQLYGLTDEEIKIVEGK